MQAKSISKANLAIFDTFKTRKNKFTGEAKRQRGIIAHLAMEVGPEMKTRTAIAHAIAKNNGILWQNIYSGIFRDLDEVLLPSGVVREGGRLPLKRGPRALQQEGMPYYELTDAGLLVTSSLQELGDSRIKMLEKYLNTLSNSDPNQKLLKDGILLLLKIAPSFVFKIVKEYITSYSQGEITELVPMNIKKMRSVVSDSIHVEKELIEAFVALSDDKKDMACKFIRVIS
ncbi:MAG: hypothetical protein HMLIMOIP_002250 [Candidatus Nitrosomirales archaeon]